MPYRIPAALLLFTLCIGAVQVTAQGSRPIFNPNRSTLYTQQELWRGFDLSTGKGGWDAAVYRQYIREGKFNPPRNVARARSLHDDAITSALEDYVLSRQRRGQLVVSVTGNALEDLRCSATYRQTALLGYELARNGYLVSTGGGPGEMEAANMGAYLSNQDVSAIDEAIHMMRLRAEKNADQTVCRYATHEAYTLAAFDVKKRFPHGVENLGVPTWFFGAEPPNVFATSVAKYFSNALREDILLSTANGAVVFTEGRAGLRQEIFQKAAQDDFASFCYVVPFVFLGTKDFADTGLYKLIDNFAQVAPVGNYRSKLTLTDSVEQAVAFLKATPPQRVDDTEGACKNLP
jgi:predicted Rossmann-fold nucleotide-binding protein